MRAVSPDEGAAFAREHGCLYKETSAKNDQGGTEEGVYDALVWGEWGCDDQGRLCGIQTPMQHESVAPDSNPLLLPVFLHTMPTAVWFCLMPKLTVQRKFAVVHLQAWCVRYWTPLGLLAMVAGDRGSLWSWQRDAGQAGHGRGAADSRC